MKTIPEAEKNHFFELPLEDRINILKNVLFSLNKNAIESRYFEIEDRVDEEYCENGK
ncbi:MAG: hypothetical protein JJE17_05950 [Peptostreptococcaceae bacterium]|nr:hypothetical protein [Peptostreptococcaceae bacterium]